VLFVSEKKAALDVVKTRIDKLGLGPLCLELHSNKVKKKRSHRGTEEDIRVASARRRDFASHEAELEAARTKLNEYADAVIPFPATPVNPFTTCTGAFSPCTIGSKESKFLIWISMGSGLVCLPMCSGSPQP